MGQKMKKYLITPDSFVSDVVRPTLADMALALGRPAIYTENTVELLAVIAAHESGRFRHRIQVGGPALSLYQIEPDTLNDMINNWLFSRSEWRDFFDREKNSGIEVHENLLSDRFSTICARMQLWRVSESIPDDLMEKCRYAKKYWNTPLGKATPEKYRDDFVACYPNGVPR